MAQRYGTMAKPCVHSRRIQYSHREIPISPARLGDTFCCLGDFLSFHRDNQYSQRDAQVTQRDVVTVHRA